MRRLDGITDSGSDHEFEQTPGETVKDRDAWSTAVLGLVSWTGPSDCTKTHKKHTEITVP